MPETLVTILVLLGAAVVVVVVCRLARLPPILGYLVVGMAVGPHGFGWVEDSPSTRYLAEFGIVFLMFSLGLEFSLPQLRAMRRGVLGLGFAQVAITTLAGVVVLTLAGFGWQAGLVLGGALAMSSTAIVSKMLAERMELATPHGRDAIAILLFQDLAVVPMLALIPVLGAAASREGFSWTQLGFAAGVIVITLAAGRLFVRPVFRHIARTRLREIFTAFALLLVLGIAILFEHAGLSMALGAFLAGVLLAESEYRHEIEAAVEPFKGLLLGLFFISVGMSVDFTVLLSRPLLVVAVIVALFALKGLVLWLIAHRARLPREERPLFILLLAQAGEFAFVLLGLAAASNTLPNETAHALILAVALSMLLTPFLLVLHDRVLVPRMAVVEKREADTPEQGKVIVAGLGRVGQVVARLLNASGYHPTVLDDDPDHVEQSRKFGFRVFYGDATRLDLLHAAGAESADYLIITLDDPDATTLLAKTVKSHFPRVRIIARARDMRHMFALRDLGVETIERETFRSALALGEAALAAIGADTERARRAAQAFAEHDLEVQAKLYEVHKGAPDAHITVSNELRDQLARTLQEDQVKRPS